MPSRVFSLLNGASAAAFPPLTGAREVSPCMGERTSPAPAEETALPLKMCSLGQSSANTPLGRLSGKAWCLQEKAWENKLENRGQEKTTRSCEFLLPLESKEDICATCRVGSYGSASPLCSQFAVVLQIPANSSNAMPWGGTAAEVTLGHATRCLTHDLCRSLCTSGKLHFSNPTEIFELRSFQSCLDHKRSLLWLFVLLLNKINFTNFPWTLFSLYPSGCDMHRFGLKQDRVMFHLLNIKGQGGELLKKKGFQEVGFLVLFP